MTLDPANPPRSSRAPNRLARLALVLFVLGSSVGCDRASKIVADRTLRGAGRISFFHDLMRLEYAQNTGAFLGLGSKLPEPLRSGLLIGVAALEVAVVLALALMRRHSRIQVVALALIAGGGLGNLWDRVLVGQVTDFMNLGLGPLRTGIFNVADLALMAGLGLLLSGWREPRPRDALTPPTDGRAC